VAVPPIRTGKRKESTLIAATAASPLADTDRNGPATLDDHLDSLAELWSQVPTPVWVADAAGTIVYSNRAARLQNGVREVAARISEAMLRPQSPVAGKPANGPPIDVSPLADGQNRRLGWLAMRQTTTS
jgi:PAS domain-containing protein